MLWTTSCRHSARSFRTLSQPLQSRSFSRTFQKSLPRVFRQAANDVPSFRAEVARTRLASFAERLGRPNIRSQVFFVISVSWAAYTYAIMKTEADTEYWTNKIRSFHAMWGFRTPTKDDFLRAQQMELVTELREEFRKKKEYYSTLPLAVRDALLGAWVNVAQNYVDATEGRRMCWKIVGLNIAVFLAWKIPRLNPFMDRVFAHDPLSGRAYTLLTSMFSHKSFLHLLANSMALASFGSAATHYLYQQSGQISDQYPHQATGKWHFLAFFLSAGLFSGLVSHTVTNKVIVPRLMSEVSTRVKVKASQAASSIAASTGNAPSLTPAAREILPSLGASGAIYAAVTMSALAYPDARVQLIFLPFSSISITTGVGGILLLDTIGVIRGWKLFDHYAHLGGAAFGAIYYLYGPEWWNNYMKFRHSSSPTSTTPTSSSAA